MLVYLLIAILIIAAAVALYLYAFRFETTNFKLSQVDIFLRQIGKKSRDRKGKPYLSILHLSDFHLRKNLKGRRMFEFVQSLTSLEVDLLFITGDLVEQDKNISHLIEMLKPLKARYGKFAVLGVHDYYDKKVSEFLKNMFKRKRTYHRRNDIERLIKELDGIGIKVLQNQVAEIDSPDEDIRGIRVAGIDDPIILRKDLEAAFGQSNNIPVAKVEKDRYYQEKYPEVFKLSDKKFHLLEEKAKLLLCLVHTPDSETLVDLAEQGADIVFSGHTHGGQVRLPGVGALLTGCKLSHKFASGLFYFKEFVLYVSRGLSEGRYSQFRFFCPPEASIIRLYKK
ncbi:MAG: metallophosphoesterase [Actinomycetia bacterium]|nr:metallophosphoesterase [Actinomycetes bacterium]